MQVVYSDTPLFTLLTSLMAALLIAITGERNRNLRECWTISASVTKFALVLSMLPVVIDGKVIEQEVYRVTSTLSIAFKVDALGMLFALTASFLWILTSFYGIGYMRGNNEKSQTRFFACFAIALSATMGVAFSANMFTTFIFYEILSLSTFPLVAHKGTKEALSGAKKYITYLLATSVAFQLTAIIMTYNYTGTLDFSYRGVFEGSKASEGMLIAIFILYIAGIAKAGMMPFHAWLPAAMVAPTPVSALLHAVAVVKTGVFLVVKVVLHIFGIDLLERLGLGIPLAYFASFTIIMASVIALTQDNLKRRLAYSTVGQLSYIVLGVALLTPSAITGSLMHITIHAFGKITLFFVAGAIYVATHKTNVSELDGIGRQMPFTMAAFSLGAISMIGVPPMSGFISKWYLSLGAIESHQLPIIIVLALSTILNGCYFLPIIYAAFFKEPKAVHHTNHATSHSSSHSSRGLEATHLMMVVPLVLTAIGALLVTVFSNEVAELVSMAVRNVSGGR